MDQRYPEAKPSTLLRSSRHSRGKQLADSLSPRSGGSCRTDLCRGTAKGIGMHPEKEAVTCNGRKRSLTQLQGDIESTTLNTKNNGQVVSKPQVFRQRNPVIICDENVGKQAKRVKLQPISVDEHKKTESKTNSKTEHVVEGTAEMDGSIINAMTDLQLKEHVHTCLKMSTENKINTKNAWSFRLIDVMKRLMSRRDPEMNDFLKAGSTLDASAKIYAARVDALHTDMLKIATGSGIASTKKSAKNEGDENASDSGTEELVGKLKRKRKANKKAIIVRDVDTITSPLGVINDCLSFSKFNLESLDSDGFVGNCVFTAAFSMRKTGDMDLGDCFPAPAEEEGCKIDIIFPDLSGKTVCSHTQGIWENEFSATHIKELQSEFRTISTEDLSTPWSDDADVGDVDEAVQISEPMEPISEVNTFLNQNVPSVAKEMSVPHSSKSEPPQAQGIVPVEQLSKEPQEYSYFKSRMWAGPAFWKITPLAKIKTTVESNKTTKRPRKKPQPQITEEEIELAFTKKSTLKANRRRQVEFDWRIEDQLLPEHCEIDPEKLTVPFLFSGLTLDDDRITEGVDDEDDYDQYSDGEGDCADPPDSDDDVTVIAVINKTSNEIPNSCPSQPHTSRSSTCSESFTNNSSVPPPCKVLRPMVGLPKIQREVNIRKLKTAVWKIISSFILRKDNNVLSFEQLCDELPAYVSPSMAEKLNACIIFNAVLHLANQHSFFVDTKHNGDAYIMKSPPSSFSLDTF